MSVLIFPDNPVNGQIYPPYSLPGVNQYVWNSSTETWEILTLPGISLIETGTGLTGGPITSEGTIEIADTGVEEGEYLYANIVVNAQGQITDASDGVEPLLPDIVEEKGDLIVGQDESTPVRLPVGNDGEVLTADSSEPLGVKWAVPSGGDSLETETFSYTTSFLAPGQSEQFELNIGRSYQLLNIGSDYPVWVRIYGNPYARETDLRTVPGPPYPATVPGLFAEFVLSGPEISVCPVVEIQSEYVYSYFTVQVLDSDPGPGAEVTLSMEALPFIKVASPPTICNQPPYYCSIYVNPYCVTDFTSAWAGCTSLTSFPLMDFGEGVDFESAWEGCTNLVDFPAGAFDSCLATNFLAAFNNCALNETSVDNILVSLDTAGESNGVLDISGGMSAAPGVAGLAAKLSLEGKGWTVNVNAASLTCTPDYPSLPVTYPPYSCNTTVNTTGVTDFSNAWDGCSFSYMPCVDSSSVTNFSYAWNECEYLTSFPNLDTSAGTDFTYSWAYSGLTSFPELNLGSGIDFYGTWAGCYYMTSFDAVAMANGVDFTYAWWYCTELTEFPNADLSSGIDFNNAWRNCTSLTSFPALNLSSGTNFAFAWQDCTSLTSFPLLDVSSGTNFAGAWQSCTSLATFPAGVFDTCTATDFTDAWLNCALSQQSVDNILVSLDTAGQSNGVLSLNGGTNSPPSSTGLAAKNSLEGKGWTVNVNTPIDCDLPPYSCNTSVNPYCVTNFSYAWDSCSGLTSFPLLNTSSGANFFYAWSNCSGLTSFPLIDTSSGTNFSRAWSNCSGLTSFPLIDTSSGTNFSHAWNVCNSLTSFPLIDTSLGVNFSSAWNNCNSLTSFPLIDTSLGVNFRTAWNFCNSLTSFPLIDTSSGTDFGSAWSSCTSLTSFPALDVSSGTDFDSAWSGCTSLTTFPAGMFDSCSATNFPYAWFNCALNQTSVDNILVSLDTAGQSNGTVDLSGGTSSTPGTAGAAAKLSLEGKGWTVSTN